MIGIKYFSVLLAICTLSACVNPEENIEKSSNITLAKRITAIPDFNRYMDVKEKKKAFFDFLRPMVKEENAKIVEDRNRLKAILTTEAASKKDAIWLVTTAKKFHLPDFDYNIVGDRKELLSRLDIIPEALFLAQAANESSWGTSRFAKVANNLFGQWCFSKGCGIVPSQRTPGAKHEVQKFKTINDAVASYVLNLNSHPAYKKLRYERLRITNLGEIPTGYQLAIGLEKYSERGAEYVEEIRSMISFNKLEDGLN